MVAYDVRTYSKAAPEDVFTLVADARTWSKWAGPIIMKSWFGKEGTPPPGGVGAVRRLGTRWLATSEEITEYDAPHYLAYTILGRAPMRGYRAIVSCDPHDGGTRITWAGAFEPVVPGTGRLLAWVLKRVIGMMVNGLARYADAHTVAER
jgi:hypothetical protein